LHGNLIVCEQTGPSDTPGLWTRCSHRSIVLAAAEVQTLPFFAPLPPPPRYTDVWGQILLGHENVCNRVRVRWTMGCLQSANVFCTFDCPQALFRKCGPAYWWEATVEFYMLGPPLLTAVPDFPVCESCSRGVSFLICYGMAAFAAIPYIGFQPSTPSWHHVSSIHRQSLEPGNQAIPMDSFG
jgi:hypothetical protein